MICQFSEPIYWNKETLELFPLDSSIGKNDVWNFSKMVCDNPTTTEKIINLNYPQREFFVEKTFSYGDALIVFFLTLFFIFTIAKGVFDFFWKK